MIKEKTLINKEDIQAIGDAVRVKTNITDKLTPSRMAELILTISGSSEAITVSDELELVAEYGLVDLVTNNNGSFFTDEEGNLYGL